MEHPTRDMLLEKLRKNVDGNLDNDQFGVEELAKNIGVSRSALRL